MNSPASTDRAVSLDIVRGIAVVAILVFHYIWATGVVRTTSGLPWLVNLVISSGAFAVDLFFALSGFLIAASLRSTRGQDGYWGAYFLKRLARLAPLYFLWLAPFLLLRAAGAASWGGAFPALFGSEPIESWAYLTFTQNWRQAAFGGWGPLWMAVTWSLAVEVQFYAIAAVVVALSPPRYLAAVSLAIVTASAALFVWLTSNGYAYAALVLTPSRLDAPFAGVIACCLASTPAVRQAIAANERTAKFLSIALLMGVYGLFVLAAGGYPLVSPSGHLMAALKPISLGAIVLVFAICRQPLSLGLLARGLRWAGVRCFAIYIIHYPMMHGAAHLLYGRPAYFLPGEGIPALILGLVATFALVTLSWRYVEAPVIQWSHRAAKLLPRRKTSNASAVR
ncbi:acyltransferase [Aurantimonas litoralis]|nr:acyltransferase [Aurantimonas litoralis]